MKHTICCLISLVLLVTALTGCSQPADPAEVTFPLNKEALEQQVIDHLHNQMTDFKQHFQLEDAILSIASVYFNEIDPRIHLRVPCLPRFRLC